MTSSTQPPSGEAAFERRGRKRSASSREAILLSAYHLAAEGGFAALTVEGIARRAGVGKQTIYRWWPSRAHVLLDGLGHKADLQIPTEDLGSWEKDLRAFLDASFRLGSRPEVVLILRALMAQAQIDPDFAPVFREEFLQRRRAALGLLLERAARRGDLPPQPAPALVPDLVFGVIWYRVLAAEDPVPPPGLTEDLLRTLVPGAGR
ncbi:TetR/AcrR family transcriptional regulator [Streptomyces sp. NPDC049954]|uniref:TetR/AcrR family transcriptional regulator n=1 Tax=Streptomyces sp. NPDC049954 TaxID=3155779 RepID=UPI00343525B2